MTYDQQMMIRTRRIRHAIEARDAQRDYSRRHAWIPWALVALLAVESVVVAALLADSDAKLAEAEREARQAHDRRVLIERLGNCQSNGANAGLAKLCRMMAVVMAKGGK